MLFRAFTVLNRKFGAMAQAAEIHCEKDFCTKTGLKQQKRRAVVYTHLARVSVASASGKGIITEVRITNSLSKEADEFTEMYYREIRSFSTDAEKIAKNRGKKKADIKKQIAVFPQIITPKVGF